MMTNETESLPSTRISAVKSISSSFASPHELDSLFETFRLMCNEATRIAVQSEPTNRFGLIELAYPQLKAYGLHTHYVLSACEVAYSVYRNKRRKAVPYIDKAFLELDNQSYTLDHLLLRIPTTPRQFIFLTLQGSDYQRKR